MLLVLVVPSKRPCLLTRTALNSFSRSPILLWSWRVKRCACQSTQFHEPWRITLLFEKIRKPSNLRARVIFASVDLVPRLLSARCSVWLHRAVIVMCVSLSMIISSVPFKRFTSMANSHLLAAHGCAPEIELGNASCFDDRATCTKSPWTNLGKSEQLLLCLHLLSGISCQRNSRGKSSGLHFLTNT